MGEDFYNYEFHDEEFEEMVKNSVARYRAKELIKMSRAVDRFGNKMHDEGYRVMIGLIDENGDFFKFYSNMNPLNHITVEMLAHLVKKACDEIQQENDLEESPVKEVLKAIEEEILARG